MADDVLGESLNSHQRAESDEQFLRELDNEFYRIENDRRFREQQDQLEDLRQQLVNHRYH